MNKDALLATFIGFAVGLVITGSILYGPGFLKSIKVPALTFPKFPTITLPKFGKATPTPTPSPAPKEHALAIDSPIADAIETDAQILVSGSTTPKAIVVIGGESDETVVVADADGKYAGKITLLEGKNTIQTASYTSEGKSATANVSVYYTEESL